MPTIEIFWNVGKGEKTKTIRAHNKKEAKQMALQEFSNELHNERLVSDPNAVVSYGFKDPNKAFESNETMKDADVQKILSDHADFLAGNGGAKANFENANLKGKDLSGADLSQANLKGADLRQADLTDVNFKGAELKGARLTWSTLISFKFKRDDAYYSKGSIIIGCLEKSTADWAANFEDYGRQNGYSDLEIDMYGRFIKICQDHEGN